MTSSIEYRIERVPNLSAVPYLPSFETTLLASQFGSGGANVRCPPVDRLHEEPLPVFLSFPPLLFVRDWLLGLRNSSQQAQDQAGSHQGSQAATQPGDVYRRDGKIVTVLVISSTSSTPHFETQAVTARTARATVIDPKSD